MINRYDISGFEFTVFGYTVEVVTHYHMPVCLAVWKKATLIYRLEKN